MSRLVVVTKTTCHTNMSCFLLQTLYLSSHDCAPDSPPNVFTKVLYGRAYVLNCRGVGYIITQFHTLLSLFSLSAYSALHISKILDIRVMWPAEQTYNT